MNFTKLSEKVFSTVYAKLLLLCAVLFTATASFGQVPPNDNANASTVLTPGATCTYITGTNLNGTTSTGTAPPGCGFASGVADVWFRALVPAGGALTFDMQPGTMTDATMAVYRGTNPLALTYITCATDGSANANMPKITVTGLVAGTSVFVRIWAGNGVNGTFGICATIPVPPPANDEPCRASELIVEPTCNYQTFTTESATNTTSVAAPIGCASYSGGDVWFKVVVPAATTALVFDTQRGVVTEGGMFIYSGASCTGPLNQIDCDSNSSANLNMPKLTVGGLTPGDTIWVRFWERGNNNNGTFGICVTLPPPPPAYDDPCSAVELIASETCTFQQFTNQNATATSGIADPGCANYNGADVWFKVLVPAGGALNIDTDGGVMTDGGMAVYRGTCNNLTILDCDDNSSVNEQMPSLSVAGLNPNDTLWVRIWENNGDNNGTFSICARIPPPGPVNDDPCGAIELTVTPTCTLQTFSNESATGTSTVDDPSCTTYDGGDVWFKVVVPADGVLVINTAAGGITDGGMAAYSGTCGGPLTEIDCSDDEGDGQMPKLTLSGLNPTDTIWIRVWEYGGDVFGSFGICVTPPPPPPANDNPCTATELTVEATCNYQTFTTADALDTPGVPAPGCGNYQGSDVWFKVVVPAGGAVQIDTDEDVLTNAAMAAYSGSCSTLALIGCDANGSANGDMPKLVFTGLTAGDTIWVRVWEEFNGDNGTFRICATVPPPPPANDEPCGATEIPVDPLACNYQIFTNESATDSPGSIEAPGCANYQGTDIWFKAVVPAGGAIRFNTDEGQMDDGGMAIYTGNCSTLSLLTCDDNSSENGNMPKITVTGLNAGDTLWVRMWSNSDDNNGTFSICATVPPPAPANDNPCNATQLTPDSTCNFQTFTNENATNTLGVPEPDCSNYDGGDVWFSVIVPSGGALGFDSQTGVIEDGGIALYTGSCGNLSLIACDDDGSDNGLMPALEVGGLTPGDTLWVRFWEYGNDNNGTFDICVKLLPPGPVNDAPCGAIEIPVAATCTFQTFTTENSFGTATVPDPVCANYTGADVWFKVVAPAEGAVTFDTQAGGITDGGMAVYSGTCDNLTLIECDDDDGTGNMPKITVGGVDPGDTLWVRIWDAEFGPDNGTFGICATIPPPPPVNDNPCTSTNLPVQANCNYQQFTNAGSFSTAGVPAPGCGNYAGGDVWFNVIVPADGALTFDTQAGVVVDGGMAVYRGTCNNLTLLECDDDDGAGNMPKMTLGGLNPGDTLWVRFWEEDNNNNGTFGICVTIPPPPPVNDNPCGAIQLLAIDSCSYQTFTNVSSYGTTSVPDPTCGDYQGSDVWFKVTVPRAGALNINTQAGTLTDAAMAIYKADSCNGTMQLITCDDNGSANPNMPYITATGITPGSTLWIRVWSNGGNLNQGTFGICVAIPPLQPATFAFTCSRDTSFTCGGGDSCFTLDALIPDIHALSDRYAVNPLSGAGCFNPYSDPSNEGPSVELAVDDIYSELITLPFTFPFFGSNYNSLVASTNGYISFDASNASPPPPGLPTPSHWPIAENFGNGRLRDLPSIDDFYDRALIMGPYHDLLPGPNTITESPTQKVKYNVTGQAPNRRWILSFYKVPLYDCNDLIQNTHQIVLYEGIGVVEVFLFDMQNCLTWNQGRAMVGMQDFTRTKGIMAPGRRATDPPWGRIGMNESWRFVPIAGPRLFKRVELFDTSGNFLATGDTTFLDSATLKVNFRNLCALQRLPAGQNTLLVRAVYTSFNDPTQEQVGADTINIFIPNLRVNYEVANAQCGNPVGAVTIHTTSGLPPFQFSSDSARTPVPDSVFTNLAPGTYYFTVRDAAGCARDTIITINNPGPITPQYTVTNAACGDSGTVVIATNGIRPIRYSSNGGTTYQSDSTFRLPAGVYNFRVIDTANCQKDTVITITQPGALFGTYAISNISCNGNTDGAISIVSVSGGTGPFTYSFDSNVYGADTTIGTLAAGLHIASIRDANGCIKDTSIVITAPAAITALYTITNMLCNGGVPGSIVIAAAGGTGTLQYQLNSNGYQAEDSFAVTGGTYTVSIRDANGCTKDTTINITEPPAITATYAVSNAKCFANSGSIVVTASGGTGTLEYALDALAYQPDDSFAVVAGTYVVHIRDANGCIKDSSITVTQPDRLLATASAGSTGCNTVTPTGTVTVTSTGGTRPLTYSKDGGTTIQSDSTFTGLGPITYSITVTDANGCTVVAGATVGVVNDLVVQAREDTTLCGPASVVLTTTTNAQTITWAPPTFLNSTSIASPTAANPTATTEYVVTAQTGICLDTDTVKVIVTLPPTVNAGPGREVIKGLDAQLNGSVSNAASFAWSPTTYLNNSNTLNPISVMPQESIVYTLTATNAEGCSNSDTVTVTVVPYCIKVKNAFTPNGDGVNDNWMVYDQFDCLQNVRVQVYNRYGSRVFESKNYRNDWKGTYNNKNLPDATYYYVIDFLLNTGISYQLRGDVTILR